MKQRDDSERVHRWRSYGPTRDRSRWFDGQGIPLGSLRPEYLAQHESDLRAALHATPKDSWERGQARRLLNYVQNERRYRTWALLGEGTNRRSL